MPDAIRVWSAADQSEWAHEAVKTAIGHKVARALKQWHNAARWYQELAIEDARALREAGSIAGLQLHMSL
jgi:hypothetical protein